MDCTYNDLLNIKSKSKVAYNNPPTGGEQGASSSLFDGDIKANGAGKVELPISAYLDLLQSTQHKTTQPPQNFFISKSVYTGVAQQDAIKMHISFEVILLRSMWTQVKLLPDTIALSVYDVVYSDSNIAATTNDNKDVNNNNSNTNVAVVPNSVQAAGGAACVGVLSDGYYLIASFAGSYKVECDILVQYITARKTGMMLDVCRAAHNHITFTVPDKDVQLKIDPSLHGSSSPPDVKPKDTIVSAMFPPTRSLSVQWTEKAESSSSSGATDEKKSKNKLMVTAEQSSLCSVGEGILIVSTAYKFSIVHGSVSSYDIEIGNGVNILSVDGLGIKKWEVIDVNPKKPQLIVFDGAAPTPISKYGELYRYLRVQLDYGLEDAYQMTVVSEVVMHGTSADVEIPLFRCLGEEIAREMGYLAVEARTNVEVAELNRDGLVMVDISEIPTSVSSLASASLLLGYKFLHPSYQLSLRVKRHSDVEVLIATCDDAYYITTVSEEGKVLHKLTLHIRNTQKQYVRINISTPHDIWSTSVAGQSVKPARDEEGRVMVPLQKSSGKSDSSDNNKGRFTVELIYIETEEKAFTESGRLPLEFATIDLPINNLCVSVFLPEAYQFQEFEGDLKEVVDFTTQPSTYYSEPVYHNAYSQSNYSRARSASMRMMDSPVTEKVNKGDRYTKVVGVLPVKVEMPTSGQQFKFEQLLVMGTKLAVNVRYKRKKNTSYGRTRTRTCRCCW